MTLTKEVEILEDIEVELDVDEIYNNLSQREKEELLDLLLRGNSSNKDYYLESLFFGKTDYQILTDEKIINKLIRTIKYNHYDSTLVERIIEELSY